MGSQEVMAYGIPDGCVDVVSNGNVLEQKHSENRFSRVGVDESEKGEIADTVLEDFEEYWEDINDRLMISRMVSDSVIKGMVSAVEQESAEKSAAKELELANLKEYLRSHEEGTEKSDLRLPMVGKACEVGNNPFINDAYMKHEKMREDLFALRKLTGEQFKKVSTEVERARAANFMKKIGSGSELVGSSGMLYEKYSESWMHVDKMLECLNTTVNDVCSKMDDLLLSYKISLCDSQEDLDLLAKLDNIVMKSVIKSLREENLLEQSHEIQTVNWLKKFHDISGLGTQLDAIQKSLCIHETGLASHGSRDLDHLHQKAFSNHVHGGNGTVNESNVHVAESYEFQQLKHMSNEELVDYFNNIIIKLKRDHETVLLKMTEDYFCLKREHLKGRGSHGRDEEFDVLRKKIPEIILKLDDFLLENERFPALTKKLESVGKLKLKVDSLFFENRQLRDSLNDKENEVKCLEARVSSAADALLQLSLTEENMLKLVENLKSALDDSCIEAALTEEVYKSALRDQIAQMRYGTEDSNMDVLVTHKTCDFVMREAASLAETPNRYGIEDSHIESWVVQGISGLIFAEAVKDAGFLINDLYKRALVDKETRNRLEATTREKETELSLEVEENMKLNQDIQDLRTALQEKEKLAVDLSFSLSKEREQFELASGELSSLREHASRQQILVTESNRDLELLKSQHLGALEQIEVNKIEMHKLKQKLDQTEEVLTEANEERNRALALAHEMHEKLLLSEVREENLKKEMELAVGELTNLFDDFECRVSVSIIKNSLRFEDTSSNLKALNKMASDLRRRELMYKQKLDLKSTNLQKAEAEVDLLGDEVDAVLRLLHKIYIALDHYSPVLKHYPGITEILELVRKEVSGESTMLM